MNHIVNLLIFISMACFANAAELLKMDDLVGSVFENVSAEGTNIVLKFKSSGRRFKYSINDAPPQINTYGAELRVSIGSRIRIVDRNTELVFSSLPPAIKEVGFCVRMTVDHRSARKMRREKEGYLIFPDLVKGDQSTPGKGHKGGVAITEPSIDAAMKMMTISACD